MKIAPKWVAFLSALGSLATSVIASLASGDWTAVGPGIGAVVTLFSHSAQGTSKMGAAFPKAFGILATIGGVATAVYHGIQTGDWLGLVASLQGVITLFSHAAGGTGGDSSNP